MTDGRIVDSTHHASSLALPPWYALAHNILIYADVSSKREEAHPGYERHKRVEVQEHGRDIDVTAAPSSSIY